MSEPDHLRTPASSRSGLQFRFGAQTPESTLASAHRANYMRRAYMGARSETSGPESTVNSAAVLVDSNTLKTFIRDFLSEFRIDSELANESYYMQEIRQKFINKHTALNIDAAHIESKNAILYSNLVMNPVHAIHMFESVLSEILLEVRRDCILEDPQLEFEEGWGVDYMVVRPFNLNVKQQRNVRDLNPGDIMELVALRGIVTRVSEIVPELGHAIFRCTNRIPQDGSTCNHAVLVMAVDNEVTAPLRCEVCNADGCFRLSDHESLYRNRQLVRLQEAPETIPEGETPQTMLVYLLDDLIDVCRPGDRVEVTGEFKAQSQRVVPRSRRLKATLRTFIEALNVKKAPESARVVFDQDGNETKIFQPATLPVRDMYDQTDETGAQPIDPAMLRRLEEWREIAVSDQDAGVEKISAKLVRSFAPSIFEYEDMKKGLLCQLIGGTEVAASGSVLRGEINILMCGDPGTAKSQLLQHAHKHTPRGVFTSGKGSSAVGLTAYVTRDPDSGELVLESGALVLSDRGVCCIDEFDKMDDSARSILNEVMEQQTVSVAKAGVVATLHARTAILAAANPVGSRWMANKSIPDNLNFPPALLSRFDLIYVVLDRADPVKDKALARHLCLLYAEGGINTANMHAPQPAGQVNDRNVASGVASRQKTESELPPDVLSTRELSAFIAHTRRNYHPRMSEQAALRAVQEYVQMRERGRVSGAKGVGATPRHLDSLIRIAQALAKLEWLDEVSTEHIVEARHLIESSLLTYAVNPLTGQIDFSTLEHSSAEQDAIARAEAEAKNAKKSTHYDGDNSNAPTPGAGGAYTPMTNAASSHFK